MSDALVEENVEIKAFPGNTGGMVLGSLFITLGILIIVLLPGIFKLLGLLLVIAGAIIFAF
ncbi:hypothetical protein ACP3TJ_05260 [Desulforudis sp. 1088]|jgi:hypothetical protein|uniref:hypothetical protein n=1 Tax=unclassified Candidatus Desulforudis TaxID=2635950 RepID=UPI00347C7773